MNNTIKKPMQTLKPIVALAVCLAGLCSSRRGPRTRKR